MKLDVGNFHESLSRNPNLFEIGGKKFGHFYVNTSVCFIVAAALNRHKSALFE
jgi:hypothetical protein